MGKLINRIPGSRLLISSLPGSALRTHVESLGKPRDVNKRSQSLAWQASRCQQAFSKPCLVNLISKDTHLVFSIYQLQFVLNAAAHVACYRLSISRHVPLSGHDDVTLYE